MKLDDDKCDDDDDENESELEMISKRNKLIWDWKDREEYIRVRWDFVGYSTRVDRKHRLMSNEELNIRDLNRFHIEDDHRLIRIQLNLRRLSNQNQFFSFVWFVFFVFESYRNIC